MTVITLIISLDEIGFFLLSTNSLAKVMACMNKLFNIHASEQTTSGPDGDHAGKQINGKKVSKCFDLYDRL